MANKGKQESQLASIQNRLAVLQARCKKLTHHDLNGNDMQSVGTGWYKYGSSTSMKYQRYRNQICKCRFCGFITIAHRIDNDRTDEVGEWKIGEGGQSFH